MSDEIIYSGLGDLRTASVLAGARYALLVADRNTLLFHPALVAGYLGSIKGQPSNVVKGPMVGLFGYDEMAAAGSEIASASNTAFTDGSFSATVVRQTLARSRGDLARLTDVQGLLAPEMLALDALGAANMRFVSMVASVTDDFTAYVGTSGSDLTVAQFLAAKIALQSAHAAGDPMAILHSVQWGDLQTAALSLGGALQWQEATVEMIQRFGLGYVGKVLGVDTFASSKVPTANSGADRAGGMFCATGVAWADGTPDVEDPVNQMIVGNVLFERDRVPRQAETAFVGHAYYGVSKGQEAAGVSIITDA